MTATANRIESWLRYDAKRKSDGERLLKERHRGLIRRSGMKKTGTCMFCGADDKDTVWHHMAYSDPYVTELCHKCHRAEHPRKMPNGATA